MSLIPFLKLIFYILSLKFFMWIFFFSVPPTKNETIVLSHSGNFLVHCYLQQVSSSCTFWVAGDHYYADMINIFLLTCHRHHATVTRHMWNHTISENSNLPVTYITVRKVKTKASLFRKDSSFKPLFDLFSFHFQRHSQSSAYK